MAIKHFLTNRRLPARIITVDKERRRVEVALRDGGMVYIGVYTVDLHFRWPRTHEIWMIRRDNGVWKLDEPIDLAFQGATGEDIQPVAKDLAELAEGETRFVTTQSETGSGLYINNHEATRKISFTIGDGLNTAYELDHNLGTADVVINVREQLRQATLSGAIGVSGSFTVDSTEGFDPTGLLYIENEKATYTGTTNTAFLSVVRGVEGTTPAIHLAGVSLYQACDLIFTDVAQIINRDRVRLEFVSPPATNQLRVTITG